MTRRETQPRRGRLAFATLVILTLVSGLSADVRELSGVNGPATRQLRRSAVQVVPVLAHTKIGESEMNRLGPLTESETLRLRGSEMESSSSEKVRVGVIRALEEPVGFDRARAKDRGFRGGGRFDTLAGGGLVWTAGFRSEGAGGIRLHLEDLQLPVGTIGFFYNDRGEIHGPYSLGGLEPHEFWTNTVFSDQAFLEIQLPDESVDLESLRLGIYSVAHLEHERFAPSVSTESGIGTQALPDCFRDASCVSSDEFPGVDEVSRAVAHIVYRDGLTLAVCSGGLLNTTSGTDVPYFLTANHCVSTVESASSLEAYWDYRSNSCDGQPPTRTAFARTLGSTVVATGGKAEGDFTLLRLSEDPPPGRFYLGWSAEEVSRLGGTTLVRVSHPDGGPQSFTMHGVSAVPTPGSCDGLPIGTYIYSKNREGATKGGSSGAPLLTPDGIKVVGQLFGRCGRNLDDACDNVDNSAVDGAFAAYFESVREWLAPENREVCRDTAVNLCLTEGRFRVEVLARDPRTGRGARGTAFPQNDVFGYFSLPELTGQTENPEVFVKIVDGATFNGHYWVFYGGLTDLELTITVVDTESGAEKVYRKDGGDYCGDADTVAFSAAD